ncbi:MAG: flagellar motor protein MotB [Spirochaetales bacterium]|nr:flagellar motor protein MotB [Spirochaetales bacterium]
MAEERKKKKKKVSEGAPDWLLTYGDMTTLLLTFFIMMFTTAEIDGSELRMILAAFQGLGTMRGGNTLQEGKLAELGNTIMSLPSMEQGRALDKARKRAKALFEMAQKTQKLRVKEDERGLIISLAGDLFFDVGSSDVNIEETRDVLQNLAKLFNDPDLSDPLTKFRIEGHTDSIPTDPGDEFFSNWELSTARATNVLHYLVQYGVDEKKFQVAGFADTVPYSMDESTAEQRALNRRVDIVVLTSGHL